MRTMIVILHSALSVLTLLDKHDPSMSTIDALQI